MFIEEEKDELDFMSPTIELVISVVIILVCSLIGTAAAYGYASWASGGSGLQVVLQNLVRDNTLMNRDIVRYSNLLVHLFSFTLSSIIIARIVSRKGWIKYLTINQKPALNYIVGGVGLVLVSLPLIALTYWVNMKIPLPDWAKTLETDTAAMLEGMLTMESPTEFLSNILVMAVIPAIGEELLFRGIILQYFEKLFRKEHLAVWITAFVFSAIHMQFEGFIPRFLLGAVLGYLFVWSRNIWIPIIAHFFFNGSQVAAQYFSHLDIEQPGGVRPEWGAAAISLIICGFIIRYLYKKRIT